MSDGANGLTVTLKPDLGIDAEELFALTQNLRGELLELDVDSVELATTGEAAQGAKAAELLEIGGLVVKFALSSAVLRSVVNATIAWLSRQRARSVRLTIDGDTLEVTGASSRDQRLLAEQWIARHADED